MIFPAGTIFPGRSAVASNRRRQECTCGHAKGLHNPGSPTDVRAKRWHTGRCTYLGCDCTRYWPKPQAAA